MILLSWLACTPTPTAPPTPRVTVLDGDSLREVSNPILDIGARLVGTPAEREAADLVESLFADAGLQDVHQEAFQWDAWMPGTATLQVGDDLFEVEALSPTPTIPERTGPLVVDGDGAPADAFVVVTNDNTSRGFQAIQLNGAGAAGMIRVTEDDDVDGEGLIEVGHTFSTLSLPSISVDRSLGEQLRARAGEMATLRTDTIVLPNHTSTNVIGEITGTGEGLVYVVAHLDSWHNSECASDNGIAIGAMVLLARQLVEGPPPTATVRFIATGAEEQGLQGAFAYVDDHRSEVRTADLVLNMDLLWSSEGFFLVSGSTDDLRSRTMAHAESEGIEPFDVGVPNPSSDQFPFQLQDVPALWAGRFGNREYHTEMDVRERIDFDEAAAALRVQAAMLNEAALPLAPGGQL